MAFRPAPPPWAAHADARLDAAALEGGGAISRASSRDLGSGDHEPGLGEASRSTPLAGRASAGRAAAATGFGSRGSPRYTLEATVG